MELTKVNLPRYIHSFFELVKLQKIEIYNELGLCLRNHGDSSFKIQSERNIKFVDIIDFILLVFKNRTLLEQIKNAAYLLRDIRYPQTVKYDSEYACCEL